ncbi:precorrin-6A synthase (deacetylating) [Asanoa ishikariensis]|uniref:Precorrin-6A synthase (Deacetylating) n=1 Tax=Asanoa ishikariensis TaxID=137265 RepID=A0A1H3S095_9ACTN|nr:precorrin-6A synthase (deacetylating) [Asanoa ishikariensis]GIF66641.1 precorrin-6A synthase (deacetylating) [Asanoa ishikariensis]SDZ31260.1 precorrin-6A synthase (deacetylating) [Asanoa ishikariensis]
MREVLVIGIGAGDPDQLTIEAVKALGRLDAAFLVDKGDEKRDLTDLRRQLLKQYAPGARIVTVSDPPRDRTTSQYPGAVDDWRRKRAAAFENLIRDELTETQRGGFLVWGDPALFDSTIGVLDDIDGVDFGYTVIPGISSVSTLAARHRIGLNRVGRAVQITTGRRLAEQGLPDDVDDLVVMLDARTAYQHVSDDVDIYWGAYLGTPDEILISGPLSETKDEIDAVRAAARARKGWIMDTYLLRRRDA